MIRKLRGPAKYLVVAILLAFIFGPQGSKVNAAEPTPPRVDQVGDSLPDGALARIGTRRLIFPAFSTPLVFTADGRYLVSHDIASRGVSVWEAKTGKEVYQFRMPGQTLNVFAWSPDAKTLVTASLYGSKLSIWDMATGTRSREVVGANKATADLTFSRDGKLLAIGGDRGVQILDAGTDKEVFFIKESSPRCGLAFMPDGKTLVDGTCKQVSWWDLETKMEIRHVPLNIAGWGAIALSLDGERLAVATDTGSITLMNGATGEIKAKVNVGPVTGLTFFMQFAPDGNTLMCREETGKKDAEKKGFTLFLDANTGKELRRWEETESVVQTVYAPDGKTLWQSNGRFLSVLDALTGKSALDLPRLPDEVLSVHFSPDGKTLLASFIGGAVGRWDTQTGKVIMPPHLAPKDFAPYSDKRLLPVAYSADGVDAALTDAKGVVHIWKIDSGEDVARIATPPAALDRVYFSPDGKSIVVKHADGKLRAWDLASTKTISAAELAGGGRGGFGGGAKFPSSRAFAPDSKVIALGPKTVGEGAIHLLEIATGNETGKITWPDRTTTVGLEFSRDGKFLVASHEAENATDATVKRAEPETSVRLWDVAGRQEVRRFEMTKAQIDSDPFYRMYALAISPDGKTLAAALNKDVVLWDIATGKQLGSFVGHRDNVTSVAFSPDGRLVASGSADFTILIWEVAGLPKGG